MAKAEFLNTAQLLYQQFIGDRKVATYKAPHAPQPTPERRHISRKVRFATAFDDDGNVTKVRRPRLFTGHRP